MSSLMNNFQVNICVTTSKFKKWSITNTSEDYHMPLPNQTSFPSSLEVMLSLDDNHILTSLHTRNKRYLFSYLCMHP